jgi:CheY-like chemotaxis protein
LGGSTALFGEVSRMRKKIVGNGPLVLVDDSLLDGEFVERCLDRLTFNLDFLFLASGEDLLAYMEDVRTGRKDMPGVVLLDLNMPTMQGFDVLARIREMPEFRNLPPVNMFSNSDRPEDGDTAQKMDAGFIVKPMSVEELGQVLESLSH